ncbi:MAG: hypothetical protein J7L15_08270 [Clostridiales bacterium]|nr:hypothetical protein [Clostridiales bacterium]
MITSSKAHEKVIFKTYRIKRSFPFSINLLNETHDLSIALIYDETENEMDLVGIQVQNDSNVYFDKGADIGNEIHTVIGDWFDDIFGIEHSEENDTKICKDVDAVFEEIWDYITEFGME